jgi:hypothetical protein
MTEADCGKRVHKACFRSKDSCLGCSDWGNGEEKYVTIVSKCLKDTHKVRRF